MSQKNQPLDQPPAKELHTVTFDFMTDPIVGCSWQLLNCRIFRVQLPGWIYVPGQAAKAFQEFVLN